MNKEEMNKQVQGLVTEAFHGYRSSFFIASAAIESTLDNYASQTAVLREMVANTRLTSCFGKNVDDKVNGVTAEALDINEFLCSVAVLFAAEFNEGELNKYVTTMVDLYSDSEETTLRLNTPSPHISVATTGLAIILIYSREHLLNLILDEIIGVQDVKT